MKFNKPQYDAKDQIYHVNIDNGIQLVIHRENNEWKQSLEALFQENASSLIQQTIQHTQGWFSKPLTPEYLQSRLQMHCPTEDWADFEGHVEYKLTGLTISKQAFVFLFTIGTKTPLEKHVIDLAEGEEEEDNKSVSPPLDDDAESFTVGPTRRRLMKMHVMRARAKVAKAWYKAEEMVRAYCDEFGDDTDWDESDEEDEDSDFEENDA